ncbi:MAG: potassium/proton antiporter [bacterium]|jgi:cell volume regulation protein A|nr:potassium/proton antiporter [bacterium]
MAPIEFYFVVIAILLLVSVLASKTSSYLGVPSLLLFLAVGMLFGSEGPGGIEFDDMVVSQTLGVIALTFILFYGGLDTPWKDISPVLGKGLILSTVGVLLTALLMGCFVSMLLDLTLIEGVLLGAIVSSTDAAAVLSVLRSKSIALKGRLRPLLELESGSNDPMAVFLTTGVLSLMTGLNSSGWDLVLSFGKQMLLGFVLGVAMGKGAIQLMNRMRLDYEGLYPVVTLAITLLIYGATAMVGGNGFLAVYIAGIILGNSNFIHKRSIIRFHDGIAWLMQIAMFLTLGLLVFPSQLVPVMGGGIIAALFLIFVARPVSVFLCLLPIRVPLCEVGMISWVGLRGAVPIILATFPMIAGVAQAELIFNLVFFIVILSVIVQGTTIQYVAKKFHVDDVLLLRPKSPLEYESTDKDTSDLMEFSITDSSPVAGKRILEMGLPQGVLIVLIQRDNQFKVPMGGSFIESGDTLLVLLDKTKYNETKSIILGSAPS